MKRVIFIIFFALILTLTPVTECRKLVLVGGDLSPDNKAVYEAFVSQASPGSKEPYIGVITAGNTWSTAESVAKGIIYRLKNIFGVANVEWLPFHEVNGGTCTSSSFNSRLSSMTGLFVNGGDTKVLLNCFRPNGRVTSALSVIQQRAASGSLAIFASSAGALALQSAPILLSRLSWGSLMYGSDCDMNGGFGVFPFGFLDVHFTERGNLGRLVRLMVDHSSYSKRGFGIDQDTAMILDGNRFKVLGSGGVYILSTTSATKDSSMKLFNVKNIKLSYLTDGDSWNLDTGYVSYASYKKTVTQLYSSVRNSTNIFADQAFETLATSLVQSKISDSGAGVTDQIYARFRVVLRKTSSTGAVSGRSDGVSLISYNNLFMDVYCDQNC